MSEIPIGSGSQIESVPVECNGGTIGNVCSDNRLAIIKDMIKDNVTGVKSVRIYAGEEELTASDLDTTLQEYAANNDTFSKFIVSTTLSPTGA